MDEKFRRRFQSFCNSLDALAEARQRDLADSFVLSGTGAKFSITFDLAWKVMKDILVQHYAITGFVAGSPREVLRDVTTLRCTQNSFIDREKSYGLEIAPVPSPVIHTMIGYIYVICRYAELILKDVADCTGHFFIIIG